MKEGSLAIGSTLAAFLASLCCLGPLLLGGVGLGAAFVATFAPLRPYFLTVSTILLAGGFYFVYRKPRATQACAGATCPQSGTRRTAKPLLWLATLAVISLAFFPSYGAKLIRKPTGTTLGSAVILQVAGLKITGMDCEVCARVIQRKLLETPGVVKAEVRYPAGSATVQFDPAQTNTEKLIAVVHDAGYKAAPSSSAHK